MIKKSILQEIQAAVIQYAKIIAHVIRVDVEIVDADLFRIVGTGIYDKGINEDMSREGFVYKHVLATGQSQLIENPGEHALCIICPKQGCCDEKLELCTPITLGEEIIGVIGLICFEEAQKKQLLQDLNFYQLFLEQIADFISAKAYERQESQRNQRMMEVLLQVVDNVDKGVLVLNSSNHIVQINDSARKQLQLTVDCMKKPVSMVATSDSMLGVDEYKVTIDNTTYFLMGDLLSVSPGLSSCDRIFIFNEIKNVKSGIYDLTKVPIAVTLDNIVSCSPVTQQLKARLTKIADSNSTVLVTGESGTGKEVIARAIHAAGNRNDRPFIGINCAAIPDTLLESELFGYVKGAFTGADPRGKIGKFELANKGVIFLDEIGDMPLYLQVKLLRVLQERKLVRIGSNQLLSLDVRVIAATNKDLKELIKEKKFREDLYYRLNVIPLEVPPLRKRVEDIEPLVDSMMGKYGGLFRKIIRGIDRETMELLKQYSWPGNIRELENTIEFMINMADDNGWLTRDTLPRSFFDSWAVQSDEPRAGEIKSLRQVEQDHILQVVRQFGDTTQGKLAAARQLGIGIATLYRKLHEIEEAQITIGVAAKAIPD
ncbi:sigma 54-interacting transcriptional regulator [Sporomusa malonica]|uniref:Transcriptional regulator containing PAS, AAA-type ATPase, and DNA-binding Fis domains n=1 Tax=Sporomusa malonica TaxID=112901 RepID=A0A1W2A7X5_9FIRM|nr:sigma 54-interacting transcriptional regulator [Sporomusa malonica]SMC56683.1 Transcriptional regulator containing PAS, AAA-type ATPase, and DNA-binding Fis domains [Sporomusa malonica]